MTSSREKLVLASLSEKLIKAVSLSCSSVRLLVMAMLGMVVEVLFEEVGVAVGVTVSLDVLRNASLEALVSTGARGTTAPVLHRGLVPPVKGVKLSKIW